jgi:hypothetical protein
MWAREYAALFQPQLPGLRLSMLLRPFPDVPQPVQDPRPRAQNWVAVSIPGRFPWISFQQAPQQAPLSRPPGGQPAESFTRHPESSVCSPDVQPALPHCATSAPGKLESPDQGDLGPPRRAPLGYNGYRTRIAYLRVRLFGDPRYIWLAGRAVEMLEKRRLSLRPARSGGTGLAGGPFSY